MLLLLLLNCSSHVQLCVTPEMAAHQALLSLGFSRQEYWSGLPFPSPMHACMLSYFSHVWLCVTIWTVALQAPLSTGFSRQEYWSELPFPSLLLLLSHFSCVWLCETPEMAAHQAPPFLGFSRHEHWSGLPFPSPMHESEKWKWSRLVISDSYWPHGLQPTRLLCPWDFPGKSTGVGCHCLLQELSIGHSN